MDRNMVMAGYRNRWGTNERIQDQGVRKRKSGSERSIDSAGLVFGRLAIGKLFLCL
jgi:hypothetical protein